MSSEEQKLNDWFNGEGNKNLVDVKVTMSKEVRKTVAKEKVIADINALHDAIAASKARRITSTDYGED